MFHSHRAGALRTGMAFSLALWFSITPNPSFAASVTLRWTAPGDDSTMGRAAAYDLRYSPMPTLITAANFSLATQVLGLPVPQPAGSQEQFTVTGLTDGTFYYFAIRSRDEANNWSVISNVVTTPARTTGVDPEGTALGFSNPWPNPAHSLTRFWYSLPRAAQVEVRVIDVAGRRVRLLASGDQPPGRGEWSWDLRNEAGVRVAPGLYLVRARLDGTEFTRRVVVTQ